VFWDSAFERHATHRDIFGEGSKSMFVRNQDNLKSDVFAGILATISPASSVHTSASPFAI
jgi:hypothetical protein